MPTSWKSWTLIAAAVVLLGGAFAWYRHQEARPTTRFRTVEVKRGDLLASVSATGTIEPEEIVDVGAQVVGMIKEFGRDPDDSSRPIDYLSIVKENTVLARIDDSVYRARFDRAAAMTEQAKAQIEQAEAEIRRAMANALQSKARLQQDAQDWERARRLFATKVISQEEYDAREAAHAIAAADVAVSEAAVDQAKANKLTAEKALLLAQADRREAQQNLDYTIIRSPVKGVIVDRRVNVGQTVVSSLNAPSLFLIAKDLKRLQVWASVNEADVGRLHPGQPVTFTVDAFPSERFSGQVSQVRLNATMTQNVVTFTVVVETDNSSGKLLPYLTANVQFEVGRRKNVLLISNAALRWQPRPAQVVADVRLTSGGPTERNALSAKDSRPNAETTKPLDQGVVWVEGDNGLVRPIDVRLGLSDGLQTEVVEGDLKEGQPVVVGEDLQADVGSATSPFTPQPFAGGRR